MQLNSFHYSFFAEIFAICILILGIVMLLDSNKSFYKLVGCATFIFMCFVGFQTHETYKDEKFVALLENAREAQNPNDPFF